MLKCIENMLHKYLETEYHETGYLFFSGVILKYNIYEKFHQCIQTILFIFRKKSAKNMTTTRAKPQPRAQERDIQVYDSDFE